VSTVFRWTPARAAASARDSQSGSAAKLDPLVDQALDAVQAFIAIMKRADEMPDHDGERGDTPERGYPHDARGLRERDRDERRDDPRDDRRCSSHPDPSFSDVTDDTEAASTGLAFRFTTEYL
jgi:hypothetical protein